MTTMLRQQQQHLHKQQQLFQISYLEKAGRGVTKINMNPSKVKYKLRIMSKVHQQPIVGHMSTNSPSTEKRTNLKFKRKKQVDATEESPMNAENQRGNKRKQLTRPQRKRKISVSRSSQLILERKLERKRKNSIRMNKNGNKSEVKKDTSKTGSESGRKDDNNTDSGANNNDTEGSKQESSIKVKERMELRKKYLGRKCKRKYKTSINEDQVATPKRKKLDDNIPIKKHRTKGKLDKDGKSTKFCAKETKSISKSVKTGEKKPKHNLNTPNLSADDHFKGKTKETALTGAKPSQDQTPSSTKPSPNPLETEFNFKLKADAETPVKEFSKLRPNQFKDKEVPKPNPNQHKTDKELGKPSPNMKAETLLEKEFSEDSSDDEEYRPNEEELNKLDDTLGDKSVTEEIADGDGIGDVTVEDVGGMTGQDKDGAGTAGPYMTRSKISYTDKALEDIEQAFIPPDIDLDMYDSVIDDQDWKEFLTEFTKPIDRISTNEDCDDTEFIPNLQDEEQIDSEEFRRDPGVKVSKKELNELMGELFDFTEIYDGDRNDEENIDANINDYVNLKFNETIQDGSYVVHKTKDTPKKVAFADQSNVNETKQNAHRKSVESNVNGTKQSTPKKCVESGKGKRKSTPDKGSRFKNNLSEDVNKQIMDEINKEINKYIQINETYVYKGDTGGDTTENYDNYEEYIVIIGNNEPSAEEINKLAQVKMAEKEDLMQNKIVLNEKNGEALKNPVNTTDQAILEDEASPKEKPSQELSIKLVQKTRIPTKSNKKDKAPIIKKPPKPKPVKEKSELVHDINYNYGKITQKQYKEIYEAYVKAIEMYKVNYGISNEYELSYHSIISEYGASLYRKHYEGTLHTCAPARDKESMDNNENVQRNMEPVKHPTMDTNHITKESTNSKINSSYKNAKTDTITSTNAACNERKTNEKLSAKFKTCDIQDVSERNSSNDQVGQPRERETTNPTAQTLENGDEVRNLHLFEEEDLKILQQQINQHIQYSLQHYLQTYNHPRLSGEASQAKQMIQTFYNTSRLKPANSFFNSLNIEAAMNLVNTWEQFHTSSVYKKHIDEEWNKSVAEWRHHTNIIALPKPLTNIILNSKAFIYPLLLPAKSFEPKPRKLVNGLETNCELNLVVLGFVNFAHILQQETKYERFKLIHDVIVAIQQNYLPAHSVKHLAKKLYDLIKSPRSNLVQEFFRQGKIEEIRHFIVDYNEENMVAPRQQHLKLLPLAWQDWVRQNR